MNVSSLTNGGGGGGGDAATSYGPQSSLSYFLVHATSLSVIRAKGLEYNLKQYGVIIGKIGKNMKILTKQCKFFHVNTLLAFYQNY